MKNKQIWTMAYFPMTMGGSVWRPMVTKIEPIEERSIGKGMKAFSFKTPNGTLRIAENVTGAIVGDSFEEVTKDVREASKDALSKQIKDANELLSKSCTHVDTDEFFKKYNY